MHNENENERFDDVFVIVIVFVLVRNLPIVAWDPVDSKSNTTPGAGNNQIKHVKRDFNLTPI
jgi:hypothetical protein